jgi:hypothetical protein
MPRRVWWYLTGPLTFLPLRAANCKVKASQSIISSYTPTLSTLLAAQRKVSRSPFRLLNHSMDLQTNLRASLTSNDLSFDTISDDDGTVEAVKSALVLEKHTWLHLSTHGVQREDEPLNSCFHLHDGQLRLADVMQIKFDRFYNRLGRGCINKAVLEVRRSCITGSRSSILVFGRGLIS